ncbi:MarR family winged helix-turn-helix transcriptional regulator [Mycobacterium sp. NAZ190054]|uniref:MarR family winged helix-turn-helix transcriptional regulator n=1 Tax=Mycobacterium sp. NAZ190054 TaxID=1747766 RepID=UPI000793B26C|nr:MarR family winged helix-turn-helix transcriptional regulator [Mycobacterium sp. NAZ190054]KWX57178.1 MarR family transcriptional regulator [Mycobacterium sp. NAZ190054]
MSEGVQRDQLLGPLLDLLARRLRGAAEVELAAFQLRPRHVVGLTLLRDFGEHSQAGLAEALGIDPTNVVALLNELESTGLVERRRSPADRRRHTVVLTPEGADRLAEIENALAGLEQRLFSALGIDEQATLHRLLQRAAAVTGGGPEVPAEGCAEDQRC